MTIFLFCDILGVIFVAERIVVMAWIESIFGDADDGDQDPSHHSRDPFGRLPSEPVFDGFRTAWKLGASLVDLFGEAPVRIGRPVGQGAPNRRADVARVETFLDRAGDLDLAETEGPTGYFSTALDQGIRRFQKENGLKVDGLINPGGPTITALGEFVDASSHSGREPDPCLEQWLDARDATERVLAIRRESEAKKDELRDLEAQIEALKGSSPGGYTPTPFIRRSSPGGRSRGARWRDVVEGIGEAIDLGADLHGANDVIEQAEERRQQIAALKAHAADLKRQIAALAIDEQAALIEEQKAGAKYDRCKQERNY